MTAGRNVAALVHVDGAHGVDVQTRLTRHARDDPLNAHEGGHPPGASHGSRRGNVRLHHRGGVLPVRDVVHIVDGLEEHAGRGRAAGWGAAAVEVRRDVDGIDLAVLVDADLVLDKHRLTTAVRRHVLLQGHNDGHGLAALVSAERRDCRWRHGVEDLPTEATAAALRLHNDLVGGDTGDGRGAALDHDGRLARTEHLQTAFFRVARRRDVVLCVERLLGPELERVLEHHVGRGERLIHVAHGGQARPDAFREVAVRCNAVCTRENGLAEVAQGDCDDLGGVLSGLRRGAQCDADNLTGEEDLPRAEKLAHRNTACVGRGVQVLGAVEVHEAGNGAGGGEVKRFGVERACRFVDLHNTAVQHFAVWDCVASVDRLAGRLLDALDLGNALCHGVLGGVGLERLRGVREGALDPTLCAQRQRRREAGLEQEEELVEEVQSGGLAESDTAGGYCRGEGVAHRRAEGLEGSLVGHEHPLHCVLYSGDALMRGEDATVRHGWGLRDALRGRVDNGAHRSVDEGVRVNLAECDLIRHELLVLEGPRDRDGDKVLVRHVNAEEGGCVDRLRLLRRAVHDVDRGPESHQHNVQIAREILIL
eukprot:PhM_4_TR16069/c1_g1_i1/m.42052